LTDKILFDHGSVNMPEGGAIKPGKARGFLKAVGAFFLIVFTVLIAAGLTLYRTLALFCTGPSEAARELFDTDGFWKRVIQICRAPVPDKAEIDEIVGRNSNAARHRAGSDTSLIISGGGRG
jgi:hypothetical protein